MHLPMLEMKGIKKQTAQTRGKCLRPAENQTLLRQVLDSQESEVQLLPANSQKRNNCAVAEGMGVADIEVGQGNRKEFGHNTA